MEEKKNIIDNEEELLKKVEKAAEKGVKKGGIKNALISALPVLIVIGLLAYLFIPKFTTINKRFNSIFGFDEAVSDHDLTLNNYKIFGYTAADFEEAVLGEAKQQKKLIVYSQNMSDVATLVNTGLFKWKVFTKSQMMTYYGQVDYTVDLTKISKNDLSYDDADHIITIRIPHAVQEEINIPEDKIQFADPEKGLLAIGELKVSPEDMYAVQAEARAKMQQKLDDDKVLETADRFAKLSITELFTPIIKDVAPICSLRVEFK